MRERELFLRDPDVPDRELAAEGFDKVVVRDRPPGGGRCRRRDRRELVPRHELAVLVDERSGHTSPPFEVRGGAGCPRLKAGAVGPLPPERGEEGRKGREGGGGRSSGIRREALALWGYLALPAARMRPTRALMFGVLVIAVG